MGPSLNAHPVTPVAPSTSTSNNGVRSVVFSPPPFQKPSARERQTWFYAVLSKPATMVLPGAVTVVAGDVSVRCLPSASAYFPTDDRLLLGGQEYAIEASHFTSTTGMFQLGK